jgi:ABC-type transporter MlaC component
MRCQRQSALSRAARVAVAITAATTWIPSFALADPLGPQDAVRSILTRASTVVEGEGTRNAKLLQLYVLAGELIDSRTMGRTALGDTLTSAPPERQAEFLDLFESLVVRAYLQKLLFFRNPRFEYSGFELAGETAIVKTRILTRKDAFRVDYPMSRAEGGWVATDIVVEDASLTRNYQRQFQSLLRYQSFEDLLDRLRRKVERLREAGE